MVFIDYDKLIRDKKNDIIESYVVQYGEEFREIIEQAFNNIRFCFFETPKRIRDYVNEKSSIDGKKLTMEFLSEMGFDTSTIYDSYMGIDSHDPYLSRLLYAFFPTFNYMTLHDIDSGIFAYLNGTEIKRTIFNQRIGWVNLSDEEIKKILHILEKYKNKLLEMYNPLISYADELDKKIEDLIQQYEREEKKSKEDKVMLNHEIFKLCVISNFDLDEFEVGESKCDDLYFRNLDVTVVKAAARYVKNKGGEYVPIVYISPLDKDYEFLDTLVDHEIRHAIEYSIKNNIVKCGIQLRDLNTDVLKYEYLNEVMTQRLSIESTLDRQRKGIYIFPDQKDYELGHVDYDEYLDVIPKHFADNDGYNCFVKSRLMPNLDVLYKYYSEEELEKIDAEIMPEVQAIKKGK